jgi:3-phenylpropionate/trans-cinnamate dioxygenase ferredoxin subunit
MMMDHLAMNELEQDEDATGRYVVTQASELPPGQRKVLVVEGRSIGVFNVHGEFYALRNQCPHRGGPLCKGRIRPLVLPGEHSQLAYEREGEILKCPWHQWEFDIKTGQALYDPHLRAKSYRAQQEGDEVVIYLR